MEEEQPNILTEEFYQEQAHSLVDSVIEQAFKQLQTELNFTRGDSLEIISLSRPASQHRRVPDYEDYNIPNIEWFAIRGHRKQGH